MLNRVMLIGNLGSDPELKHTQNNKSVTSFRMATGFKTKDKENTEWHNIVCWERTAENVAKFMKKGARVYVEGRIQTRSWDKDGTTQYKTEIVANQVLFLDSKNFNGNDQNDEGSMPF